ncbi:hypothetical protein K1719_044667 [Acacia pycnantha]|nr:hypothetical protein K1719_044667 [Acacia pycnantha]
MYGSRCAILGGIKRGSDMTISGKIALVCGYDDASQGCAMVLKKGGADVVVAEADPDRARQALLRGFWVINKAPDGVVSEADILVANFNMDNIDVLSNVKNMKNNAVIYNTGPILDHNSSTPVALFEPYFPSMKQIHTEKLVSSDTNKCVIVVSNPGDPNLMPSRSATSHGVPMLEFVRQKETGKYVGKYYAFPEHLDEKVSDLQLGEQKAAAAKKETEGQAAAPASVPSQERENPSDAVNRSNMLIIPVAIIGALAYALSKVFKRRRGRSGISFSASWDLGN